MILSSKHVLPLKQETILFPDSDIYIPDIIHRTLKEVHTRKNSVFPG